MDFKFVIGGFIGLTVILFVEISLLRGCANADRGAHKEYCLSLGEICKQDRATKMECRQYKENHGCY